MKAISVVEFAKELGISPMELLKRLWALGYTGLVTYSLLDSETRKKVKESYKPL